jgi:hypothetical protein
MSPRRNWDTPFLASECAPPPRTWEGGQSAAGEGLGESHFRRLEKKLSTLPALWSNRTVGVKAQPTPSLPHSPHQDRISALTESGSPLGVRHKIIKRGSGFQPLISQKKHLEES